MGRVGLCSEPVFCALGAFAPPERTPRTRFCASNSPVCARLFLRGFVGYLASIGNAHLAKDINIMHSKLSHASFHF